MHPDMQYLQTPRLILRPFTLDDAEALHTINRLPDVMRFSGEQDDTVAKTRHYLKYGPIKDYQQYGYGRLACVDPASEQLIGFCGLKYLPSLDEVDIGYRLHPDYWGRGLATETSQLVLSQGIQALALTRVIGLAMPANIASVNVLKKLGMHYEHDVEVQGNLCAQYAWQAQMPAGAD